MQYQSVMKASFQYLFDFVGFYPVWQEKQIEFHESPSPRKRVESQFPNFVEDSLNRKLVFELHPNKDHPRRQDFFGKHPEFGLHLEKDTD